MVDEVKVRKTFKDGLTKILDKYEDKEIQIGTNKQ